VARKAIAKKSAVKKATKPKPAKRAKKAKRAAAKSPKAVKGVKKAPKAAKKSVKKKAARKKSVAKASKRRVKTHLTRAQLNQFRDMLLAKRRDLIGDLTGMEAGALRSSRQSAAGDLSSMPTHPADVGSDNYEQEFTLGLLESERALLNEIDEALGRINDKTYGVCAGTGKPISKARLTARPWAKYTIEYARMVEQGLVRPGDEREDDELDEDVIEGVAKGANEDDEEDDVED